MVGVVEGGMLEGWCDGVVWCVDLCISGGGCGGLVLG